MRASFKYKIFFGIFKIKFSNKNLDKSLLKDLYLKIFLFNGILIKSLIVTRSYLSKRNIMELREMIIFGRR
jgi:hypothetical protein